LTSFNDGRSILEETSQNSIVELTRMFHVLKRTSDYFETFSLQNSYMTIQNISKFQRIHLLQRIQRLGR